jgi:hypothetical protein
MSNSVVAQDPLTKTPGESLTFSMEFANILDDGEFITSIVSVVELNTSDLTIGTPTQNGTQVLSRIQGGIDGNDYAVLFSVLTSEANTRQGGGILFVRQP